MRPKPQWAGLALPTAAPESVCGPGPGTGDLLSLMALVEEAGDRWWG